MSNINSKHLFLINDLTLVIPTFNRPEHLGRLLDYYASQNVVFNILVLDSSHMETKEINAARIAVYGDRFQHVRFDTTIAVAKKLSEGLRLVTTEFAAFCADDDVVFSDGLVKARDYLKDNPECVCADGIYLNFMRRGDDLHAHIEYASEGINAEHPGARVFRLFQRYESLFYGVFRTRDLSSVFSSVSCLPTLHFQELFQAVGSLLIGKSHRLRMFYAGRQHCEPAEPTRDKWQTFYWFADDRVDFLTHYVAYRTELATFYENFGQEPKLQSADFEKAMDLAHATFFGVNCPPEYFFNVLQPLWPDDKFIDCINGKDNICEQLKSRSRRRMETLIRGAAKWLDEKLQVWNSNGSIARLESRVRKPGGVQWRCQLPSDLIWLAGTPAFQEAYEKLCFYFEPKR